MGLLPCGEDLRRNLSRGGMSSFFPGGFDFCKRSNTRSLWSRGGWQKHQRRAWLQFAEELQCGRIIRFEAGRELVHQAGLLLDQCILVSAQGFEFGDLWALRFQSAQIRQFRAAMLGQQIGIDQVRLGTASRTLAVNRFGIDRIPCHSGFQQGRNEQPMNRFPNTSNVIKRSDILQKLDQSGKTFWSMFHSQLANLAASFVDDHQVMVAISPIPASVPHDNIPPTLTASWRMLVLIQGGRGASFQSSVRSRNTPGKLCLLLSVEPGGGDALSLASPVGQVD